MESGEWRVEREWRVESGEWRVRERVVRVEMFQERPELPPTQAQATARCIPPEQYSYTASILRLLRNKPFLLLILTYGLNVGCFYAVGTLLNRTIIEHYPVSPALFPLRTAWTQEAAEGLDGSQ
ncbi:unnamed protein product [Coregonus sp. 'balchen']|nr:unnamed protein product [Coregonus sp. 'balchen']